MPGTHALLSASAAHRWLNCTPSVQLTKDMPDTTSDYAKEGSLAHEMAELKLTKHFTTAVKPSAYKKQLKELQEKEGYSPEMDEHTSKYLDYVKDLASTYKAKPYVAVEQRIDYSHIAPSGFGTTDCVLIGGDTLTVVDFKYGKGVPVSAENNPQMMLYAVGALAVLGILYDIKNIKLCIFQPRLDSISEWEITTGELNAWAESIKPIAQQAFNGEGEYCAGEWCRFCKAKSLCRARAVFSQEPYTQFNGMLPPLISSDEAAEILKKTDVIKKWIIDLEDWALSALLSGETVPGWKAVEGRSNRQFEDIDKAFTALKGAGYDEAVLYERKPLTLTALEKLIGGKAKLEELLSDYIIKPPGKPTLAPESDKRPAITNKVTAAEAFGVKR